MCGPLNTTLVKMYMNPDSDTVDVSNLGQMLPLASVEIGLQ